MTRKVCKYEYCTVLLFCFRTVREQSQRNFTYCNFAVHPVFVVLYVRNCKNLRKIEKILHQLPFYFCQLLILLLWSVHCTVRSKITVYQRLRPLYIFLFYFLGGTQFVSWHTSTHSHQMPSSGSWYENMVAGFRLLGDGWSGWGHGRGTGVLSPNF